MIIQPSLLEVQHMHATYFIKPGCTVVLVIVGWIKHELPATRRMNRNTADIPTWHCQYFFSTHCTAHNYSSLLLHVMCAYNFCLGSRIHISKWHTCNMPTHIGGGTTIHMRTRARTHAHMHARTHTCTHARTHAHMQARDTPTVADSQGVHQIKHFNMAK